MPVSSSGVTPDSLTGKPRGEYAPVYVWTLPRSLQVAQLGWDWHIGKRLSVHSETAFSAEDRNRLSRLDDDDNLDIAHRSELAWAKVPLGDSVWLSTGLSMQHVGARYTNIDRVYQAEYNRIWDLAPGEVRRDEQILMSQTRLKVKRWLELQAEAGVRHTGPGRIAWRQVYGLKSHHPKYLQGHYRFTRIENRNDSLARHSRWTRHEGDVFLQKGRFKPGVEIWVENREMRRGRTLSEGSFAFGDWTPYLEYTAKKLSAKLSYNIRHEQAFAEGRLRDKSQATTWQGRAEFRPLAHTRFSLAGGWRRFTLADSIFYHEGDAEELNQVNANLQADWSPLRKSLNLRFFYEAVSEQSSRQEVRFIEVNPGQGDYVWLDSLYNRDGIQQVNEFQLANNPLTANYIRVLFPTERLFPTVRSTLRASFRVDPARLAKKASDRSRWWQQLRLDAGIKVNQRKNRENRLAAFLINPGSLFTDSLLLDAGYALRQQLDWTSSKRKARVRLGWNDNRSKLFLLTGDELRVFKYYSTYQLLNLGSKGSGSKAIHFSIENDARIGQKLSRAEQVEGRDYDIRFIESSPKFNVQFGRRLRVSAGYAYVDRLNRATEDSLQAQVYMHKAIQEAKWSFGKRNNINARLELAGLRQNGTPPPAADYELKDGLQKGFNAIWQVFFNYFIFKDIELNLTYDGRASQVVPVIHTGRVQMRAYF